MNALAFVRPEPLSDGSKVWNVYAQTNDAVRILCVNESTAREIANAINRDAVDFDCFECGGKPLRFGGKLESEVTR